MALHNVLRSFSELQFSCTYAKSFVRRLRGYRYQPEHQAVPKKLLDQFRENPRENVASPAIEEYNPEELQAARRFKFVHPEFMPASDPEHRDPVRELLEREDMMKRRAKLDIPEFYVGSILAVTLSDPYADGGESKFVGICIERSETGLKHNFVLRNYIDNQGIEIMYELYNPTIKKIEVIKLEKRLDEELLYLRDAPPEYSEVPFDIEAIPHPRGAPVPINPIKVKLNPRPWRERWERSNLIGFEIMENCVTPKMWKKAQLKENCKPWERYDLVKKYRESVPLKDQDEAYVHFTREHARVEKEKVASLDRQLKAKENDSDVTE